MTFKNIQNTLIVNMYFMGELVKTLRYDMTLKYIKNGFLEKKVPKILQIFKFQTCRGLNSLLLSGQKRPKEALFNGHRSSNMSVSHL